MAQDKKISELDSIPTALTGTEEVAIVQGGTTYKGTVADFKTYIQKGNFSMSDAGALFSVKSGTGQRAGNATLVAGTLTVVNTTVTNNSIILLSRKTIGGTAGNLTYTVSDGASFTIDSDNAADTSVVSYFIIELV